MKIEKLDTECERLFLFEGHEADGNVWNMSAHFKISPTPGVEPVIYLLVMIREGSFMFKYDGELKLPPVDDWMQDRNSMNPDIDIWIRGGKTKPYRIEAGLLRITQMIGRRKLSIAKKIRRHLGGLS